MPERWSSGAFFTMVPDHIARLKKFHGGRVNANGRMILAKIARNAERGISAASAQTRLAEDLGLARSTVARLLSTMECLGLLRRRRTMKSFNRYGGDEWELLPADLVVDDAIASHWSDELRADRARWTCDHVLKCDMKPCPKSRHGRVPSMSQNETSPCLTLNAAKRDNTEKIAETASTETGNADEEVRTPSKSSTPRARSHDEHVPTPQSESPVPDSFVALQKRVESMTEKTAKSDPMPRRKTAKQTRLLEQLRPWMASPKRDDV